MEENQVSTLLNQGFIDTRWLFGISEPSTGTSYLRLTTPKESERQSASSFRKKNKMPKWVWNSRRKNTTTLEPHDLYQPSTSTLRSHSAKSHLVGFQEVTFHNDLDNTSPKLGRLQVENRNNWKKHHGSLTSSLYTEILIIFCMGFCFLDFFCLEKSKSQKPINYCLYKYSA